MSRLAELYALPASKVNEPTNPPAIAEAFIAFVLNFKAFAVKPNPPAGSIMATILGRFSPIVRVHQIGS